MSLQDILFKTAAFVLGPSRISGIMVNRSVNVCRNRPHPWSTRNDYISWAGLTDRTYNARLLPPDPDLPANWGAGPAVPDVVALFAVPAGASQRKCIKSSCLFPTFAQYLTDGFIRTMVTPGPPFGSGFEDRRRTTSNHDIDLSPLYGRTEAQTLALRSGQGGRLKSEVHADGEFPPRLFDAAGTVKPEFEVLDLPLGLHGATPLETLFAVGGDRANATPGVSAMNTLFLREHNRLADLFAARHPDWDDERLFQTARNVVIVMYIKLVVEEYINHISTAPVRFLAESRVAWTAKWNRTNWMTAEFSLLYRWHSLIPERIMWGNDNANVTLDNSLLLKHGVARALAQTAGNQASNLGLQNTIAPLLPFEARAIEQGRTNKLASYNAYRLAMGMKPARSFAEVVGTSGDAGERVRLSALAARLQQLYGSVDNLEFYVGLFAERTNRNGPLPPLIQTMVAVDAFSQALTNPLLSEHIWGDEQTRLLAFTAEGLEAIRKTATVGDIVARNSSDTVGPMSMTLPAWKRA